MRVIDFEQSVHPSGRTLAGDGHSVAEPVPSRLQPVLQRLSATEFRRRVYHMLPGFLPFLLWSFPHRDPLSPFLESIIVLLIVGLAVAVYVRYHYIAREDDGHRIRLACVLGYAGSVVGAVLVFPSAVEIAFAVLAILAFGDGSATLFGKLLRGPALPWNRRKTWTGFLAFILVGLPTAALAYWGESQNPEALQPAVTFGTALLIVGAAVVAAAVAESLQSRLNDNVRVGLVSLACVVAAHSAIVGW